MNRTKTLTLGLFVLLMMGSIFGCNAQTSENKESNVILNDNIEIYYFHFSKRCATCNAVESETKLALEKLYGEKLKEVEISFTSLNLDIENDKKIAETLKISGQTLLLVKGDKQVNLTNDGFMNARNNPQKFHEILKTQIDNLL